jgi:hypothetical protein
MTIPVESKEITEKVGITSFESVVLRRDAKSGKHVIYDVVPVYALDS